MVLLHLYQSSNYAAFRTSKYSRNATKIDMRSRSAVDGVAASHSTLKRAPYAVKHAEWYPPPAAPALHSAAPSLSQTMADR